LWGKFNVYQPYITQRDTTMQTLRKPTVAGQFYPDTKDELLQQIQSCYLEKRGYGELPKINKTKKDLFGLIVPHAGYIFSGAIASFAYHHLSSCGFADSFVILGPNHTGMGSGISMMTEGAWETPLGKVPIDSDLASQLHTGLIDCDETAHHYEHSIEVQLPFLQHIAQDRPFDFVPIAMMMQDEKTANEIGNILADVIQKSSKKIVIIASSDFSHVGFNYQSMPPKGIGVDSYAESQDQYAIEQILALQPNGLIKTVHQHQITMCGSGPIASLLVAAKKLGASTAELLKYGTSYAVHPSTSCVGYAAIQVS